MMFTPPPNGIGAWAQFSSSTPSVRRAQDVAMDRRSKHLNSEERGVIFAEHQRSNSQRGIGILLGRPASTIGREPALGRQDDVRYCPAGWAGISPGRLPIPTGTNPDQRN